MELRYYICDPAKNMTLLVVSPVERGSQRRTAAMLMEREKGIEQVGFIEPCRRQGGLFHLQMAGGEFCGNGSLSAAAVYALEKGQKNSPAELSFSVSGAGELIRAKLDRLGESSFRGSVSMPLPDCAEQVTLELSCGPRSLPAAVYEGITHVICPEPLPAAQAEEAVRRLSAELGGKAAGIMFVDERAGTLRPLVYEPAAGTLFWEHSCASGTAAAAACMAVEAGRSLERSFAEPGGVLGALAEIRDGRLSSLSFQNRVDIVSCRVINYV